MTRALYVTQHAVARFVERWSPGLSEADARAELEAIVAGAAPTKRQTLNRDARVWVATSPAGQRIALAVRDATVVTVFASDFHEAPPVDMQLAPEDEVLVESEADRAAGLALVAGDASDVPEAPDTDPRLPDVESAAEHRRQSAEETIARWKVGGAGAVTERAVRRAHAVLGRRYEPAAPALPSVAGALRIDGGRYGGVAIELRDSDTTASIVGRLLGAMRGVDEGRRAGR